MTSRTDPIKRESANRFFSAPRVCWRCGDHKPRQGGAYQPGSNPLRSGGWWCADCIARRSAA